MHAARAPPQEIGGAVALLHAQGLCHADIKPENLLLTGEESKAGGQGVKLVDFGGQRRHLQPRPNPNPTPNPNPSPLTPNP